MTNPRISAAVAGALSRYPEPVQARLYEIRDMIFVAAEETDSVGPLTETLKWGEPAYLTEASGSGSTIRLGSTNSSPLAGAVLFNCKTTLVETFRTHFADEFAFEGNRALIVPVSGSLRRAPLMLCLCAALTYHRRHGIRTGVAPETAFHQSARG